MKRVKQLMNEYLHYIKTEKDNYKKAVQANYEAMNNEPINIQISI